jgi:hypothetical protein
MARILWKKYLFRKEEWYITSCNYDSKNLDDNLKNLSECVNIEQLKDKYYKR